MRIRNIFIPGIICICIITACKPKENPLERALISASQNENELQKALSHFNNDEDSLKKSAVEYLISNMPGNYSFDTSNLYLYRPILFALDSMANLEHLDFEDKINPEIKSKWNNEYKQKWPLDNFIYSKPVLHDIQTVKAEFLIRNTNLAFYAWLANPYVDSISYYDFCNHILPYRFWQGGAVDDFRSYFLKKHNNYFLEKYPQPICEAIDSLLYEYREIMFSSQLLADFPYLIYRDILLSKKVLCDQRCWFNSMLFSSLGIPVVIDFVPLWGHGNNGHSWNALIYGGKTYAFDPFWGEDRWKYNRIYNNISLDSVWGKFCLPKIYRHTFATHYDGPAVDKRVAVQNIPSIFQDLNKKDVSEEYFEPFDVKIRLKQGIPDKTYYAYLCVFNNNWWQPVQWGKINKQNEVIFEKMGREIIYIPGLYINGTSKPLGAPFYLRSDGQVNELVPSEKCQSITIKRKYRLAPVFRNAAYDMKGIRIEGANNKEFRNSVLLAEIDFKPEVRPYSINSKSGAKFRYVRFVFNKTQNIAELKLLGKDDSVLIGTPLFSHNIEKTDIGNIEDNNMLTYCSIKIIDTLGQTAWFGYDLKYAQKIKQIVFCSRNHRNHILPGLNYELFYWLNGWVSLGVQKATGYELTYNNVPKNALYILRCLDEGKHERIFTIEGDKTIWH